MRQLTADNKREIKDRANAIGITLDGAPATVVGIQEPFAIVYSAEKPQGFEWSWPTVARIVAGNGQFWS